MHVCTCTCTYAGVCVCVCVCLCVCVCAHATCIQEYSILIPSSLPLSLTHTHSLSLSLSLKYADWDKDFDNWILVNLYWTAPTTESTEMPPLIHDSWPDKGDEEGRGKGMTACSLSQVLFIFTVTNIVLHIWQDKLWSKERLQHQHRRGKIYLNAADFLLTVMKRFHPMVLLVSKSSQSALHTKQSQHLSMVKSDHNFLCSFIPKKLFC